MGMGEPLYNYKNVKNAAEIMGDKEGIQLSTKRITLSTSGIVPEIIKWGNEVDSRLAISLHATNDELRNNIVPINKKFPLKELIKACREYPRSKNSKRITFEYVMLKGVNDTAQDARKLVKLISGIPAKINLIPFNPWPNSPYECSSKEEIKKFSDIIKNAGYASPVRKTRGQDIMAACGQLKSSSIKIRKSELRANG
jgi:23S rRNA (adenine2503-C2)-methyltransferase